jgi:hypothetical protein
MAVVSITHGTPLGQSVSLLRGKEFTATNISVLQLEITFFKNNPPSQVPSFSCAHISE